MKSATLFLSILSLAILQSCVQKSYDRTILFKLHPTDARNVKMAGVRGNDKPLGWDSDFPLTFNPVDSTYVGVATIHSGYLFTAFKFTVNGEFELKDQTNRVIYFKDRDTIRYEAYYNSREFKNK
jgi:hypothetical protein